MIYCESCGAAINHNGKFCEKCGHRINWAIVDSDLKKENDSGMRNQPDLTIDIEKNEENIQSPDEVIIEPTSTELLETIENNEVKNLIENQNGNAGSITVGVNISDTIPYEKNVQREDLDAQSGNMQSVNETDDYVQEKPPKANTKNRTGRIIGIISSILAVGIIAVILIIIFSGGNSDTILYIKNGKLYSYSISGKKSKEEGSNLFNGSVSKNERSFTISMLTRFSDKNNILVYPQKISSSSKIEYQLYWKKCTNNDDEDKEKIETVVKDVYYADEDLTHLFYIDDDKRLFQYNMDEKEKGKIESNVVKLLVSNDANTILFLNDDGVAYIKNYKNEKKKLSSDVDSILKIYDSGEAYYIEKDIMSDDGEKHLCYYDGEKSKKIANIDKRLTNSIVFADNKPVAIYPGESDSLNNIEWYVTTQNNRAIDIKNVQWIYLNPEGNKAMFFTDVSKDLGDLYEVNISGDSSLKTELYDSEVADAGAGMGYITDTDFLYYKEINNYSADLVINKKTIDYNVLPVSACHIYDKKRKCLYYLTDTEISSRKYTCGTLKSYDNKKVKKIADDVFVYFDIMSDGSLVYLADYNSSNQTGDLTIYNEGKKNLLVNDVEGIVSGDMGKRYLKYTQDSLNWISSYSEKKSITDMLKESYDSGDFSDLSNLFDW